MYMGPCGVPGFSCRDTCVRCVCACVWCGGGVCVCVCGLLADSRAAVICWLCFPVSYLVYTHFFSTNMRYECLSAVQVPLVFLFSGFCLACSEEGAISQTMWTSVCPHVVACPPTWWRTCGARLMAWVRAWS